MEAFGARRAWCSLGSWLVRLQNTRNASHRRRAVRCREHHDHRRAVTSPKLPQAGGDRFQLSHLREPADLSTPGPRWPGRSQRGRVDLAYRQDPTRGKDRPVLVVGRDHRSVLLGLLVSARAPCCRPGLGGNPGSGAWDYEGRLGTAGPVARRAPESYPPRGAILGAVFDVI